MKWQPGTISKVGLLSINQRLGSKEVERGRETIRRLVIQVVMAWVRRVMIEAVMLDVF